MTCVPTDKLYYEISYHELLIFEMANFWDHIFMALWRASKTVQYSDHSDSPNAPKERKINLSKQIAQQPVTAIITSVLIVKD